MWEARCPRCDEAVIPVRWHDRRGEGWMCSCCSWWDLGSHDLLPPSGYDPRGYMPRLHLVPGGGDGPPADRSGRGVLRLVSAG